MRSVRALALVLCASSLACIDTEITYRPDAGRDGGSSDAGLDAGQSDAGSDDAGAFDAGAADAGGHDAGASDAGSTIDAGGIDAGADDAGSSLDAGGSRDGGGLGADAGSACPRTATGSEAVALQINAAHTGAQPGDSLALPLCRRWTRAFDGFTSPPVVSGGRAFISVQGTPFSNGSLYALDLLTGATVWGPIDISSAVAGDLGAPLLAFEAGRVFLVRGGGQVQAYDANSGTLLWSTQLQFEGMSYGRGSGQMGQVVSNGILFTMSGYVLFALSASSGAILWARIVDIDAVTPTAGDGRVFVSTECRFVDVYAADGGLAWEQDLASCSGGMVSPLANGSLFIASDVNFPSSNDIRDARTGMKTGSFPGNSPIPVVSMDKLILGGDRVLWATDLSGMQMLWTADFPDAANYLVAPPLAVGAQVAAQTVNELVILDAANGAVVDKADLTGLFMDHYRAQYLQGIVEADGVLLAPVGYSLVAY